MYFIFQLMEENLFRLLIMFYGTFSFSSNIETMYLHLSNTVFRLHYTKYLAGLAEVQWINFHSDGNNLFACMWKSLVSISGGYGCLHGTSPTKLLPKGSSETPGLRVWATTCTWLFKEPELEPKHEFFHSGELQFFAQWLHSLITRNYMLFLIATLSHQRRNFHL